MKTCPDCGERVYNLGCVNCNEAAYIQEQIELDALYPTEQLPAASESPSLGSASPGERVESKSS